MAARGKTDGGRRRPTAWSWLKAHAWPVRIGLALVAAALGVWGLADHDDSGSWAQQLYSIVQLFVLDTGDVQPPVPGQLQVARLLAAGVASSAVWGALALLFAEQFARLRIRWFLKNHVVVCGLGRYGTLIAKGFREQGDEVVAVDLAPRRGITESRAPGTIVLVGDATDPRVLEQAGVAKARLVVVTCGEDGTNAEVAIAARAAVPPDPRRSLTCLVHIADPDLSALLTESEIANPLPGSFRLEFFDPVQRGVAELMRSGDPLSHTAEAGPHLLVVGLGQVGRSVIVRAARAWSVTRPPGRSQLRITAVDIDADARVEDLRARYTGLSASCEIVSWPVDVTATEFQDGASLNLRALAWPFSNVYVCLSDDARSLGAALLARRRLPDPRLPIVARTSQHRGLASLLDATAGSPYEHIRPFSPEEWMCRPDALRWGPTEILARVVHEHYVKRRRLDDLTGDDPAMADWEHLSEDLRNSNRRLAREIGVKLRSVGRRLQPLSDWDAEPDTFSDDEIERLAEMEHEAWKREREAGGWTYGDTKDFERRRSPHLVPWAALPSEIRRINRELVRELPAFLANVGFAVVRTTVVGVTGHRVLTDDVQLCLGIDEALGHIESLHPGRPLTVVSALAEGADRLVALRALTRPGSRLVAVLPLPADDYLQDFATERSREEFHRLLGQAERVVEMTADGTRDEAYAKAGEYVLNHADVLLALWDGAAGQGPGGTAGVVALARQRGMPVAWVHAGNREPQTLEPTSLGEDQGQVTYENL